jgi:hypothetical protein
VRSMPWCSQSGMALWMSQVRRAARVGVLDMVRA